MIVQSQLPPKKKLPSCTEEEEPEDMLLSRFAEETDLLDWYFIWFLRLDSFCFYQCVYFCKKSLFQVECFEGSTYVGFDLCHRRFWKCMSVSYVYCNRCKCINCSLENVVHMKDVHVAWRLIDVVREGQKLC